MPNYMTGALRMMIASLPLLLAVRGHRRRRLVLDDRLAPGRTCRIGARDIEKVRGVTPAPTHSMSTPILHLHSTHRLYNIHIDI